MVKAIKNVIKKNVPKDLRAIKNVLLANVNSRKKVTKTIAISLANLKPTLNKKNLQNQNSLLNKKGAKWPLFLCAILSQISHKAAVLAQIQAYTYKPHWAMHLYSLLPYLIGSDRNLMLAFA